VKEQGLEGFGAKRGRIEGTVGRLPEDAVNEGQEFVSGGYTVGGRTFERTGVRLL
jgi:hypothetical protein